LRSILMTEELKSTRSQLHRPISCSRFHQYTSIPRKETWNLLTLGYVLDSRGVRVPVGAGDFSPHHRVQTDSEAYPASYTMGTRGFFPGDKADRAWSRPLTSF